MEMGPEQTALNPVVLVEVLSDRTPAYDRGEKLMRYQSIPSLQPVMLVEPDATDVEVWSRGDSGWTRTVHVEPDKVVELAAIDVSLPVAEIYAEASRFPG